jgi:hypothetical protein
LGRAGKGAYVSEQRAVVCGVKSLLYPPIELHGHRGSAWRVIEYVPLVTNFIVFSKNR